MVKESGARDAGDRQSQGGHQQGGDGCDNQGGALGESSHFLIAQIVAGHIENREKTDPYFFKLRS